MLYDRANIASKHQETPSGGWTGQGAVGEQLQPLRHFDWGTEILYRIENMELLAKVIYDKIAE